VTDVYKLKCETPDPGARHIYKLLLNSLYGAFGKNTDLGVTRIKRGADVTYDLGVLQDDDFLDEDPKALHNTKVIINTTAEGITTSFSKTYTTVRPSHTQLEAPDRQTPYEPRSSSNVSIAGAITAYGRLHMFKLKKRVGELGGEIIYTDTDSLTVDITLPDDMVSKTRLGALKLEASVIRLRVYALKKYLFQSKGSDYPVVKWAGVDRAFFKNKTFDEVVAEISNNTARGMQTAAIFTHATEAFSTYLKLVLLVGAITAFPVLAIELYLYVRPGLYSHEDRRVQ